MGMKIFRKLVVFNKPIFIVVNLLTWILSKNNLLTLLLNDNICPDYIDLRETAINLDFNSTKKYHHIKKE